MSEHGAIFNITKKKKIWHGLLFYFGLKCVVVFWQLCLSSNSCELLSMFTGSPYYLLFKGILLKFTQPLNCVHAALKCGGACCLYFKNIVRNAERMDSNRDTSPRSGDEHWSQRRCNIAELYYQQASIHQRRNFAEKANF